jgi:adenosine kinase
MHVSHSQESRVLVTGSLAYDYILTFPGKFGDHILPDKLHMINLSFLVDRVTKQRGGCAGNVAYTLALLGELPSILAAAGHDFDPYAGWLRDQGVNIDNVRVIASEMTATCFITTDQVHNQITGFYVGAMKHANELSLKQACGKAQVVIVSPDDPEAMKRHCEEAKEVDAKFVYDPSFQVIAMDGDFLWQGARGADALVLNDYEFSIFLEKTGKTIEQLHEEIETLVVTLGEKGSRILQRGQDEILVDPVVTENAVDPTGCGDAYRGGFITGMVNGCSLKECGQLGSVASVFVVEQYGTQNHHYSMAEFAQRYQQAYGSLPAFLKEAIPA